MEAERAANGSFGELYDAYVPAVMRYLVRLTGSREEAEDLAQEKFSSALMNAIELRAGTRSMQLRSAHGNSARTVTSSYRGITTAGGTLTCPDAGSRPPRGRA